MTFGEKVKNLRKNKGLSQTQLADAVGVSLRTVRGWEIEGRYPKKHEDVYKRQALHDVMEQAVEQGVDFNGMEPGEITTIKAMARTAGVGSQQVTIEKGPIYRYADYGLGTYLTEPYYISYGSVRATAYCIQPAKPCLLYTSRCV